MGTVRVCWSTGPTAWLPWVRITSGASATSSAAYLRRLSVSPPVLVDPHIAADGPTQVRERLLERGLARRSLRIVLGENTKHADEPHALALLRARRKRPSGYSVAEKCDEVPPPHGAYPKAKDRELIIAPCVATKSGL